MRATACPDASSGAAFAMPLRFPDAAASRLGRLTITQPSTAVGAVHVWRRFIDASSMEQVQVDMEQAAVADSQLGQIRHPAGVQPPAAEAGAPLGTPDAPSCGCRCSWMEVEDVGDRSLPTFLAIAAGSAPTCLPPSPHVAPSTLTATTTHRLLTDRPLAGLGAACVLQALALAALLLRRGAAVSQPAPAAAAGAGGEEQRAPESPQQQRPSLRDACTSPLVALLASPFVLRKAQDADTTLESIPEGEPSRQEEEQERPQGHPQGHASLPPPPVGWSRCARASARNAPCHAAGAAGGRHCLNRHPPTSCTCTDPQQPICCSRPPVAQGCVGPPAAAAGAWRWRQVGRQGGACRAPPAALWQHARHRVSHHVGGVRQRHQVLGRMTCCPFQPLRVCVCVYVCISRERTCAAIRGPFISDWMCLWRARR